MQKDAEELIERTEMRHVDNSAQKSYGDSRDKKHGDAESRGTPVARPPRRLVHVNVWNFVDAQTKVLFSLGVLASLLNGLVFPLLDYLSSLLAGIIGVYQNSPPGGYPGNLHDDVFQYIIYLAVLAPSALLIGALQGYLWMVAGERATLLLRKAIFEHHMGRNQAYHDEHGPGEFSNMVTRDAMKVREAIGERLGRTLTLASAVLFALTLGLYTEWRLAVIIIGASIIPITITTLAVRRIRKDTEKVQQKYSDLSSSTLEVLSNIRTVFSLNGEAEEWTRYNAALASVGRLARAIYLQVALRLGASSFFMDAILSPVFLYAGWLAVNAISTQANIINTFLQVSSALNGLNQIVENLQSISDGQAASGAIFEFLLDAKNEAQQRAAVKLQSISPEQAENANISFKNVMFSYPSRPGVTVIDNLSLDIPYGSKIAFVGRSGSGKSTITQLLLRLHNVSAGSIFVGNLDLASIEPHSWRENVGLVNQEPVLFRGTIADNVALGCLTPPSREQIVEACQLARVAHVIDRLPLGYDSIIAAAGGAAGGGGGVRLSGGEKQRLAIARALLRRPKFMIFDECTSALDVNTEKEVQDAIDAVCHGMTSVIIAHRLGTIRNADCICVLEQGRIVEKGTHNELLELEGIYAAMIRESVDGEREITEASHDRVGLPTFKISDEDDRESLNSGETWSDDDSVELLDDSSRASSIMKFDTQWIDLVDVQPQAQAIQVAWNMAKGWHGQWSSREGLSPDVASVHSIALTPVKDVLCERPKEMNKKKKKNPKGEKETKKVYSKAESKQVRKWFLQIVGTEKMWVSLGLFGSFFLGGLTPLQSLIMANNFSVLSEPDHDGNRWRHVIFYSSLFLGFAFLGLLGRTLRRLSFSISGTNLANRVRSQVFGQLLSQDMYFYDEPEQTAGALATMLAADPDVIERLLEGILGSILSMIVSVVIAVGIAMGASWKLTLFMFACAPLVVFANYAQLKGSSNYAELIKLQLEKAGTDATAAVSNAKTIMCLGKEQQFIASFSESLDDAFKQGTSARLLTGLAAGCNTSFFVFGYIAAFVYIYHLIIRQLISFHDVLVVVLSVMWVAQSLGALSAASRNIGETTAVVHGLHQLMSRNPRIRSRRLPSFNPNRDGKVDGNHTQLDLPLAGGDVDKQHSPNMQGRIVFQNVDFAYPALPDKKVLSDLTLTIEQGQTVAFIGPSGSGKSTVASLLSRLYDPTGGKVTVDGIDLKEWDLVALRRQVAVVAQEPVLFSRSVRENIAYGASAAPAGAVVNVTEEQLVKAAAVGSVDEFVDELPNGYETVIGTGSVSGGQKQRIAIARACIRKPRILILDEATSALDVHNEKIVRTAIDTLTKDITTIMVAHRLSTVRDADKIVLLSDGVILESGTHSELLAMDGAYAQMVRRQEAANGRHAM
ncbi:hypothetical protein PhCBS80983_g04459 [Powellomyces hirtus]|uniref:Uncharacterized protein n=1 Tax=Powellomyces hirtus TaxID=109895 RepID=A0A507E0H9_9FUNG|nr:hypothetical protein PhCBS80983_g04459 [Powellomyces hirtus]